VYIIGVKGDSGYDLMKFIIFPWSLLFQKKPQNELVKENVAVCNVER
jgi:hypothetical protein